MHACICFDCKAFLCLLLLAPECAVHRPPQIESPFWLPPPQKESYIPETTRPPCRYVTSWDVLRPMKSGLSVSQVPTKWSLALSSWRRKSPSWMRLNLVSQFNKWIESVSQSHKDVEVKVSFIHILCLCWMPDRCPTVITNISQTTWVIQCSLTLYLSMFLFSFTRQQHFSVSMTFSAINFDAESQLCTERSQHPSIFGVLFSIPSTRSIKKLTTATQTTTVSDVFKGLLHGAATHRYCWCF